jgi:hypothetical protein
MRDVRVRHRLARWNLSPLFPHPLLKRRAAGFDCDACQCVKVTGEIPREAGNHAGRVADLAKLHVTELFPEQCTPVRPVLGETEGAETPVVNG